MLEELNTRHGIAGRVTFVVGEGGHIKVSLVSDWAVAEVYLHGATVTRFQPRDAKPVLWLSRQAVFQSGKAIRGGIPVCWPWFGPHPSDKSKPQHGFARISEWGVAGSIALDDGSVQLRLKLADNESTRALWPHEFELELAVTVGRELKVELTARNPGREAFQMSGALHSYFQVGDICRTQIAGLAGAEYVDQPDGNRIKRQSGPVRVAEEVDRIYLDTDAACLIDDAAQKRIIKVAKSGSRSTVVWNPWAAKAAKMSDFPDDGWRTMVCVETANAANDARELRPGESHTLTQVISIN